MNKHTESHLYARYKAERDQTRAELEDTQSELEFVRGQRDTWHTEAVRLAQELDKATKSDKV